MAGGALPLNAVVVAAPKVRPRITSVANESIGDPESRSVGLRWAVGEVDAAESSGPLTGFRIMAHKLSTGAYKEFYIADPAARVYITIPHPTPFSASNAIALQSYTLPGLEVYEKYMLSIAADNNFGYSPTDTVFILTSEGSGTHLP